jgi:diguanylate cyclase (GGDEF)-like protein
MVLDTVNALMQAIGGCAVDTDTTSAADVKQRTDRWRRHLMLGLAHPVAEGEPVEEQATRIGVALHERDWRGAARFALDLRQGEQAWVTRTVTDLRETAWTLLHGLHEIVGAERAAGRDATEVVEQARRAIDATEASALRDAARAAVAELAQSLARREEERLRQIEALGQQVAQLGAALEEARREGSTDPLTGLGNRRTLDDAIAHAVALNGLWGRPTSLLILDLDGLKDINDEFGHPTGDAVLQAVARRLAGHFLRRSDVICRLGGDEFVVVLRDAAAAEAMRLAERVVAAVGGMSVAPVPLSDAPDGDVDPIPIGVSAGVAELQPNEGGTEWLARADAALYAAKRAGRRRAALAE